MQAEPFSPVKQPLEARTVPGYLDFVVSVVQAAGATTVRVNGDLDCHTAPQLRSALLGLVDDGATHVVLDVGGTQFMDSTGLSVLVGGLKRLRDRGGSMVLQGPSPATLRLLEITGLRSVFDVV